MAKQDSNLEVATAEEWFVLSLTEICSSFNISKSFIVEIIDEGIVSVDKEKEEDWRFDSQALQRIKIVMHLTKDLGINMAGAGLAIDLLQEIERLEGLINKTY